MSLWSLTRWFLVGALSAVVLVAPSTIFPFFAIKLIWFRLCISLASISVLWWAGFRGSLDELRAYARFLITSPLVRTITVFVGSVLVTTLFAYDVKLSFWSNLERGEGWFMLAHYYLFFIITLFLLRRGRMEKTLLHILAGTSLLVVGYGILAALDAREAHEKFFVGPVGTSGILSERFSGSWGNAGYLGSYLLLTLFLGSLLFMRVRSELSSWSPWAYGVVGGFLGGALLLTQTRGAFLGLIAGILTILGLLITTRSVRYRRGIILGSVVFLVFAGTAWFARDTRIVQETPIVSRLARISFKERSLETRKRLWEVAVIAWHERPLVGWGEEHFSYVFDRHFDIRHFIPGEISDTWYDRAHNIVLDRLAASGLLGTLTYVSIFIVFFAQLVRRRHSLIQEEGPITFTLYAAFPIVYIIQGMVLFDGLYTYLPLFLFFALMASRFRKTEEDEVQIRKSSENRYPAAFRKSFAGVGIVVMLYSMYIGTYRVYIKSKRAGESLRNLSTITAIDEVPQIFEKGVTYAAPLGHGENVLLVTEALRGVVRAIPEEMREDVPVLTEYAERIYAPLWTQGGIRTAKHYTYLGEFYTEVWRITKDDAHGEYAKNYYEACLTESPRRPQCLIGLFENYLARREWNDAERIGDEILSYWPSSREVRVIVETIKKSNTQ